MNVNAKFALPTLIETLQQLARQETDPVLSLRFANLALLLLGITNDKVWNDWQNFTGNKVPAGKHVRRNDG